MNNFIQAIYLLKRLRRQGWVRSGIPISRVESIAEHSFATAVLALILGQLHNSRSSNNMKVDVGKLVIMALLHDMPEAYFMDFDQTIEDLLGVEGLELKLKLEENAIRKLLKNYLVEEEPLKEFFTTANTLERDLLDIADKLELLGQVVEYKKTGIPNSCLNDFFISINDFFNNSKYTSGNIIYSHILEAVKTKK